MSCFSAIKRRWFDLTLMILLAGFWVVPCQAQPIPPDQTTGQTIDQTIGQAPGPATVQVPDHVAARAPDQVTEHPVTEGPSSAAAAQEPVQDLIEGSVQDLVRGSVRVSIQRRDEGFTLYRGGEPYYIKGIGGSRFLDNAAAAGANSVRTWDAGDADDVLERAQGLDMTVMLGIWLSHDPADYDDLSYRQMKIDQVQDLVQRHRNHPALLMWALGNEINLEGADTESAWRFVDDLARLIRQHDDAHPVVSVIACNPDTLENIAIFAPALDAVGINAYGTLADIRAMVDSSPYTGPYMITEWGVKGHWEAQHTAWGRPLEPTSAWKADFQLAGYERDILANRDRCIGAYVFLWGQKQERTPTWYSMILEELPGIDQAGLFSPAVDAMHYNWTGNWPANRAPEVLDMLINGTPAEQGIVVAPGEALSSWVNARDPEADRLTYVWELLEEPKVLGSGGSFEPRPASLARITQDQSPELNLSAPLSAGEYRLFVYVLDNNGHAATANIPFQVRPFSEQEASAASPQPNPS